MTAHEKVELSHVEPTFDTPDSQPIPSGEVPERRFQRIGEAGMKVLHGSERLLLAAGLVRVLVYVCTRIYATAMY